MTKKKIDAPVESVESKCKHIFSFEEGVDYEAWLNYEPKLPDPTWIVTFNYCPLCGEKLEIGDGITKG